MSKFKYKIYISMTVVWMIIIFINSSFEGDTSSGLSASIVSFMVRVLQIFGDSSNISNAISLIKSDGFHLFLRKTAHFIEFGILGILFTVSLGYFSKIRDLYMKRFSI
ncbi:MAG: VanZ family protein, partial [Clostridiales bacterium]|nr:VanZ family protein [Clostridiales bacterium]